MEDTATKVFAIHAMPPGKNCLSAVLVPITKTASQKTRLKYLPYVLEPCCFMPNDIGLRIDTTNLTWIKKGSDLKKSSVIQK
eukprot:580151-Ditylum_brightwellii.AAC.1